MNPATIGMLLKLARQRSAVVPLAKLAAVLQLGPDDATEMLVALETAGLVERWPDSPEGPAVILSPRGAGRIGFELAVNDEANPDTMTGTRELRWIRIGKARNEHAAETTITDLGPVKGMEGVETSSDRWPDPRAVEPVTQLIQLEELASEEAERKPSDRQPFNLYIAERYVRLILGIGIPWPARKVPGQPCPGCGGRKLPRNAACVVDGCDRTGIDGVLPSVRPSERPRAFQGDSGGLTGGKGRQAPGKGQKRNRKRTRAA